VTETITTVFSGLPIPIGVRLNEIMVPPSPSSNKNAAANNKDQWIELYNPGLSPQDISGWMLASHSSKGQVQRLPANTVLDPGKYLLVYPSPDGIVLADKNDLVLLFDQTARLVDVAPISSARAGGNYSRDPAGEWHTDWKASPGAPNSPPSKTTR
jgi:hypothetical protein